MTQLTNQQFQSIYGDLLTTTNQGQGLTNILKQLQDGFGNASTVTIATNAINFDRTAGTFQLDAISLTASATDINAVCTPNPTLSGTGGVVIPRGTTAQRPVAPINGTMRYNTTTQKFEGFEDGAWVDFI